MRIAVLGAGSSGGHLAYRLVEAGHDVSILARGPHLDAIRRNGLRLDAGEATGTVKVAASDDVAKFERPDAIIVGVKATGLAGIAPHVLALAGPDTTVWFPQNGMPWWYGVGIRPPHPLPDLAVFRAGQPFLDALRPEQIAGGTLYTGNEVRAPGVIFNSSPGGNAASIAELVPGGRDGVDRLIAAFDGTPVVVTRPPDLRMAMWRKLLQNMSGSAIGVATRNRSSISREDPRLREIYTRIIREGNAIAAAWGYPVDIDPEEVIAKIPHHRASILQDYDQGRPMEVGEIVLAPAAFARAAGVPCPSLDAIGAIVARLAIDKGLYDG